MIYNVVSDHAVLQRILIQDNCLATKLLFGKVKWLLESTKYASKLYAGYTLTFKEHIL